MKLRVAQFLALIAALQILGGHWLALQSVAWVTMVIDYSKETSIGSAIEKTFDGAHPCSLCQTVSKGLSQERKSEPVKSPVKFEAVLGARLVVMPPSAKSLDFPKLSQIRLDLVSEPLVPPPLA